MELWQHEQVALELEFAAAGKEGKGVDLDKKMRAYYQTAEQLFDLRPGAGGKIITQRLLDEKAERLHAAVKAMASQNPVYSPLEQKIGQLLQGGRSLP